ncbi:MAG: hypothetical protein S4CHLAM20_04520 [Chlamydiia bacterium]|nr:hypothetical protein [Chlamydiia bacterium]
MNKHEEFKIMMSSLGLSYRDLADMIDLEYSSLKSMLAPSKDLPRWALSMLIVFNNKSVEGAIVEIQGKNYEVKLIEV